MKKDREVKLKCHMCGKPICSVYYKGLIRGGNKIILGDQCKCKVMYAIDHQELKPRHL